MTTPDTLLWVVLPYVCLAVFIVGHLWRYKYDNSVGPPDLPNCMNPGCCVGAVRCSTSGFWWSFSAT